jgi:putative transposase
VEVSVVTARSQSLADIPEAAWREACRREAIVRQLSASPRLSHQALTDACLALQLGKSQVYEILRRYRADPRATSLVPAQGGTPKGADRLAPEIAAIIERSIERFYLTRQKLTGAALFDAVQHECRKAGFRPPSLNAVRRRVAAKPAATAVRAREGAAVAAQRFRPVPGSLRTAWPLDVLQIDHTPVDLIVVDEAVRRPVGRPWLTLAMDVDSRMVAGFLISLDPPGTTSVALALAHAVMPKTAWLAEREILLPWPVAGLPRAVHVDNAKEFHSRALERGCRQHGICLDHRPIRTPRYGGHIERLMGTLMRRVHELPGTTFSNVREKGDADPAAAASLTLRELEMAFALDVLGPYHMEVHSVLGIPPLAAWSEHLPRRPQPPLVPRDGTQWLQDFLPFKEVTVRREGIRLHSIFYYDDVLTTWLGGENRRLRAKYDPRDLSTVFLEDETGRHWPIRYRDLARPAITLWEQKAAVKNLRARGRCLVDEQSIFEAVAARRVVVAQAVAKTNSARREAERRVHLRSVGRAGGRAAAASSRTARRTRTPVTRRWCRCPRRRIWAASRNGRE